MNPQFYKLSHGANLFRFSDMLEAISDRLAYVHRDTAAKGKSQKTQAETFVEAPIGAYFYLTYGNQGVYLLGQFTGPVNYLTADRDGWMDRPYRPICFASDEATYAGTNYWWAPNHNSTFVQVPDADYALFEQYILKPFFGLSLPSFGVR